MIVHASAAYSLSAVDAFRTTGDDVSGLRSLAAFVTEAVTFVTAHVATDHISPG